MMRHADARPPQRPPDPHRRARPRSGIHQPPIAAPWPFPAAGQPADPIPPGTLGDALARATATLRAADVPTPGLDALLLLCHATALDKATVLAHPERSLEGSVAGSFETILRRRAAREPLAYLLGHREFFGRDFLVTPAVLVPRPETELLVELALDALDRSLPSGLAALDVGTGCGAVAVTLAAERPPLQLLATDRALDALALARQNAVRHHAERAVHLVAADLLAGLRGPFSLVVANLPYVPTAAIDQLMPEVARAEPRLALDGGPDGLVLIRRLIAQVRSRLAPGGLLLLEHGHDQGPPSRAAARGVFPHADVATFRDLAGHERVLRVECR